jgi:hypothetical protein
MAVHPLFYLDILNARSPLYPDPALSIFHRRS